MTLDQIRAFCNTLPGVTEDIKWEDHLCFSVGAKMFLITGFENDSFASLKVTDEEFEELAARPGIIPAPYLARYKWVQVQSRNSLSVKESERLIAQSYKLVKSKLPKKVLKQHGLES